MPKFETTDSVKLFYETVGEGPPLILIHPPLMGHVVFRNQKELAKDYRLILLDLRGHGHSDRHVLDVSMPRLVEDIHELMDHLQIQQAAILGYSAGGVICQAFASHYPDRVSALILSGGFLKVESMILNLELQMGTLLTKWRRKDFLSKVIAKSHSKDPNEQKELFDYGKKVDSGVVETMYRECRNYDGSSTVWHLGNVPILLLYGKKGNLKKHARTFLQQLPQTKVVYIEHAGHQLPTQFAGPFNNLVDRFLKNETAVLQ